MRCAWKELLSILPPKLRKEVSTFSENMLQEIRLRINAPPALVIDGAHKWLDGNTAMEDIQYVVNAASRYSPWSTQSMAQGYLTAPGGHRIGICGEVVVKNGQVSGFSSISSLCIRVAHDLVGIGGRVVTKDSVLILGAPGWGKTTLLRDLARQLSQDRTVCVVDERKELFPEGFETGKRMDVLWGCPKTVGISMATRTMGADWIAVDEITDQEDCQALLKAANCGVRLAATAHASSLGEYLSRTVYRPLVENRIFGTIAVMNQEKSYILERIRQ